MTAGEFKTWCIDRNLTLDEVSKLLGISRRMIAYYRSGKFEIPKIVVLAINNF